MTAPDVEAEFRTLAEFYGLALEDSRRALEFLQPWMRHYTEFVLADRTFEVIVGAAGGAHAGALVELAARFETPPRAREVFTQCVERWPDVMLGLKVRFGPEAGFPSLYIRTMAPMEEGMLFLSGIPELASAVPALRTAMRENSVLYGVGIYSTQEHDLCLKTYTIGRVASEVETRAISATRIRKREQRYGFISYRAWRGELRRERKQYLPEMSLTELEARDPRWREVIALAQRLGYGTVGHVGIERAGFAAPAFKLYVERIGAIPTDYAAR